jgi:hypothetical protein
VVEQSILNRQKSRISSQLLSLTEIDILENAKDESAIRPTTLTYDGSYFQLSPSHQLMLHASEALPINQLAFDING